MMTLQDVLLAAVDHHNAGRLAEAERLYRQVLVHDPLNADAVHLLGLVASAAGQLDVAERRVRLALTLRPDFPDACYNLGNICRRQGRFDAALPPFLWAFHQAPHARNRVAAAQTHAEVGVTLAGGLGALNTDFNAIHRRNRDEPLWRADGLGNRLGAAGRALALGHIEAALALAPRDDMTRHLALLMFVAAGDLERGLAVVGPAGDECNPELGRLGAEVAWYLRRADDARAQYEAFIRRKCRGEAPLRPLLAEAAAFPAFANRPLGPFPADRRPVIIYTHYGNPDFLHYSIAQSRISNPGARIILIGDSENRIDGVEHYPMQAFAAAAAPMVARYRHDSNNSYCYELFCIARWFLFLDLCERQGIEEMFLLDSDYMLFGDLAELAPRCRGVGAGFSFNSAHFSYFRRDVLAAFCRRISAFFAADCDPGDFHRRNNSTLFSDMAFIFDFQRQTPHRNFCAVQDGGRFDYSITNAEGFHNTDGIKDIRFIDGAPYAFVAETNEPVRFFGLHFQGLTKPMMRQAFLRQPWGRSAPLAPSLSPAAGGPA